MQKIASPRLAGARKLVIHSRIRSTQSPQKALTPRGGQSQTGFDRRGGCFASLAEYLFSGLAINRLLRKDF